MDARHVDTYLANTRLLFSGLCRPEPVLRAAVERLVGLLRERRVNYFYALDQFKVPIFICC